MSAKPVYEPCGVPDGRPDISRMIADLGNLGFVARGHWKHVGHSRATGQVTLLENPRTLDTARVLFVTSGAREAITLAFETRFEDGTEVVTGNNQITSGLPIPPEITSLWLPQVRDAGQLGRIHAEVRDRLGFGKKRLPVGQDAAAFLAAGSKRMLA